MKRSSYNSIKPRSKSVTFIQQKSPQILQWPRLPRPIFLLFLTLSDSLVKYTNDPSAFIVAAHIHGCMLLKVLWDTFFVTVGLLKLPCTAFWVPPKLSIKCDCWIFSSRLQHKRYLQLFLQFKDCKSALLYDKHQTFHINSSRNREVMAQINIDEHRTRTITF